MSHNATLPSDPTSPLCRLVQYQEDYAVFLLDAAGRVLTWNTGAQILLGYDEPEIVGQSWGLLFPREDQAAGAPEEALQQARLAGRLGTTRWHVRRDGSRVWVEGTVTVLQSPEEGFGVMLRDGTESRRAQESARLLAALVESSDDAIIGKTVEGTVLSWNAGAERIYGYTADEAIGRSISFLIPSDRADDLPQIIQRLKRGEKIQQYETARLRKDGVRLTVSLTISPIKDAAGRVLGASTIARDITRQKRLEEALQASEERLRLAVEGAGLGTWHWNIVDDTLVWSDRCRALFGIPAGEEMTYVRSLEALHPDDRERVHQATQATLQTRQEYDIEFRVVRPDGTIHWLSSKGRAYYDAKGNPTRMEGLMLDIDARKQAEAVLTRAYEKESQIAEVLQRSMLLSAPEDKFTGLSVETLYEAALDEAKVGGDFFDAFLLRDDRVALVVGDVSGKGLAAAARTAEIKYALRAFLHEYQLPAVTLARLNDFVCETQRLEDQGVGFIVLALAIVDRASGEASFAAAGAEQPLLLRRNGTVETVAVGGRPLGVAPGADYAAATLPLARGDTVLMATDGITEARQGHSFLGSEGLARLARQAGAQTSLSEMGQAIYAGACSFAGGMLRDDACLLLARRH